ncbi:hypothetical protein NJB14197_04040 [Mycobacterium montefiorense]|uniref:Uncharacterized protein n=1 Tax=Mycobacterium montefiorense TaxID=154654 RepID=A0AA37PR43_9MYCO|nr:hypothetical protein MmonteBS_38930 [Mycobacterium montefiorense]GKU36106.1 hypothetical protein NJB14191_34520 [Mycobacterium montefiorense]GKU41178.1 hypothetical protein NJB14192_31620 [Mycobacterium montefiorense]GKU44065.1 hypothetical protein NJB14194_06960 [Mycobacterium montefiorense]GKU52522.1 hypothetical protein NJB14195_37640 [Mycobacterium montefiorense]
MIGSSGSAEATPAAALNATAAPPTAAASLLNDSVIMLGHLPRIVIMLGHLPRIYKANDGYLICPNGCRLGRGYQPLRAFFCFTFIRSPGPERNYPQDQRRGDVGHTAEIVWVITARRSRRRVRIVDAATCTAARLPVWKLGNHRGVPTG